MHSGMMGWSTNYGERVIDILNLRVTCFGIDPTESHIELFQPLRGPSEPSSGRDVVTDLSHSPWYCILAADGASPADRSK